MAEMLSPGVYVTEIDSTLIAPTVSNSICVFAGNFDKGPVDAYTLITSVDELISFYGLPGDQNYNDWYQAYNFLQYGNKLFVARAANTVGTSTPISGEVTTAAVSADITNVVAVTDAAQYSIGSLVSFGGSDTSSTFYEVVSVDSGATPQTITLDRLIIHTIPTGSVINSFKVSTSGVFEAVSVGGTELTTPAEYLDKNMTILNFADFEEKEPSIAFSNTAAKVKFMARNPGTWSQDIEIAIATPSAFKTSTPSRAFDGVSLNDLFEYFPTGTQVGVIIRSGGAIKEIFTVDFDPSAKDVNNKSTYIETVINNQSNIVFVKDNTDNAAVIKDYLFTISDVPGSVIKLVGGRDSEIQADDLQNAYDLWNNKEEVDIDIVIANELDGGVSAKNLCDTRKDCIGFIGATYGSTVGKKTSDAVALLINWRTTGVLNYNNMFVVACGNYKYQYDRYNDKNRWINIAGDIAGLRAQTSMNRASWWASAGLERGQIKNVRKLAFNPNQGHRDLLYKNGINPIVSFPGQGTVMWG